jgi:hypothetical protein
MQVAADTSLFTSQQQGKVICYAKTSQDLISMSSDPGCTVILLTKGEFIVLVSCNGGVHQGPYTPS